MTRVLDRLYAAAPPLVQSLGISAYSAKQRLVELGGEFRRCLAEFEQMQWSSVEELRAYQDERLRALIQHCYDNVPYYRRRMDEARLVPADVRSVDDLPKLPTMTAEDVRNNLDSLISRAHRRSALRVGYTSGSTGAPLELYYDRRMCIVKNAADWRQKRLAGIELGDRMAIFWGRVLVSGERSRPPFWRHNWTLRQLYSSSYHVSPANLNAYLCEMKRFRIEAIEGYPSALHAVARHLQERGETLPLKAVFTSSEILLPIQREDLTEAFGCPVFDYYGMAERVVFATECDHHRGLHLNMDFGINEVLSESGEPVPPGSPGWLVGTSLHNFGMPLVRYRSGDVTSLSTERCPCGRSWGLLGGVTARAASIVTTPDGRQLSVAILSLPFKQIASIVEAQIVQEELGRLVIHVVRRATWSEDDRLTLLEEFERRIGTQMALEVRYVDKIARTRSGKFPFVVSKVTPALLSRASRGPKEV